MTSNKPVTLIRLSVLLATLVFYHSSVSSQDIVGSTSTIPDTTPKKALPNQTGTAKKRTRRPASIAKPTARNADPAKGSALAGLAVATESGAHLTVDRVGSDADAFEAEVPKDEKLFVFQQLPPGRYIVSAELAGYDPANKEVTIAGGRTLSLTLHMERSVVRPAARFTAEGDKQALEQHWPEAETAYRHALVQEPNVALHHHNLGWTLYQLQQLDQAETEFRQALRLDPNLLKSRVWLGFALYQQKRYADAEAVFREVVKAEPNSAIRYGHLGETLVRQQKWTDAESAYRQAALLEPNNAQWQFSVGLALYQQRRFSEAEAFLTAAAQIEPARAIWFANLGANYIEQGKWKNAEASYRQALILDASQPVWHNQLGLILYRESKFSAAETEFKIAISTAPGNAHFNVNLGSTFLAEKHWPEAEQQFKTALALDGSNAGWYALLATSLYRQDKFKDAETAYLQAVSLQPNDALAQFNLGILYLNMNQKAKAVAQYQKLKALDQALAEKLNNQISQYGAARN